MINIFKMCLASFIKHRMWFDENIDMRNSLRCSLFWDEDIPLSYHVMTRFPCNSTCDTPEITDLPLGVFYLAQIEAQNIQYEKFKEAALAVNSKHDKEIIQAFEQYLDLRSV